MKQSNTNKYVTFFTLVIRNKVVVFITILLLALVGCLLVIWYQPPLRFDDTDDSSLGIRNATHTVRLFGDFTNDESRQYFELFQTYHEQHPMALNFIYKNFPASNNVTAEKLARATECAHKQGFFWELSEFIYQKYFLFTMYPSGQHFEELLRNVGGEIEGIDLSALELCVGSNDSLIALKKDQQEATTLSLSKPPVAFFDNKRLGSIQEAEDILQNTLR